MKALNKFRFINFFKKTYKNRLKFLIIIIAIIAVPSLLITFEIIDYELRFAIGGIVVLIVLMIEIYRKTTLKDLGFRYENLKESLLDNGILSILIIIGITISFASGYIKIDYSNQVQNFYIFYILLLAPLQEFVFRSLIFKEFNYAQISNKYLKIVLSAAIFVLPHLIYKNATIIIISFAIGLAWGWIYNKNPNFIGVAISHSILGTAAIIAGII